MRVLYFFFACVFLKVVKRNDSLLCFQIFTKQRYIFFAEIVVFKLFRRKYDSIKYFSHKQSIFEVAVQLGASVAVV